MPSGDEITKGDCHDCPWYEDCPRMRGVNICYSDRAGSAIPAGIDEPGPDAESAKAAPIPAVHGMYKR